MRIAFMGTPDFSVPCLAELLAAGHEIAAVYSQPPRKSGRGQKLTPSPVQAFAEAHGLTVRTPLNFKAPEERDAFAALDLDLAVVVAYGLILPQAILDAPRLGCVNVHASLLPRWRGAAPIQRAIEAGDSQTGVTIMQMEAGLDTGPMLLVEKVAITDQTTGGSLHDDLAKVGASLIVRALAALERGSLEAVPQPAEGVTYAHKYGKDACRIDWGKSAQEVERMVRAFAPVPGAWFEAPCPETGAGNPVRIKVRQSETVPFGGESAKPGTRLADPQGGLVIACGEGALRITDVQRQGKGPCSAEAFLRGFALPPGAQVS